MNITLIVVQVLIAIIYTYVILKLYIPYVYNNLDNQVAHNRSSKNETNIITSKLMLNSPGVEFDTQNRSKYPLYKKLFTSSNISGGSQYTITFWLNKDRVKLDKDSKQLNLLLIGNKNATILNKFTHVKKDTENSLDISGKISTSADGIVDDYNVVDNSIGDTNITNMYEFTDLRQYNNNLGTINASPSVYSNLDNTTTEKKNKVYFVNKPTIVQKAPFIYFRFFTDKEIEAATEGSSVQHEKEGVYLVIEYNSLKNFNNKIFIPQNGTVFQNLNVDSVVLFSLVMRPVNNLVKFTSGYQVIIYLNTTEVFSQHFPDDTVVSNNGNIHVLPKLSDEMSSGDTYISNKGFISDVSYWNYALESSDVRAIHSRGHNDYVFTPPSELEKERLKEKYYRLSLNERTRI